MANYIELTTGQGPRAINIDHIQSFASTGQGTRISYQGNNGQVDVQESYEVVRGMLSVTPAPQPHLTELIDKPDDLVLKA